LPWAMGKINGGGGLWGSVEGETGVGNSQGFRGSDLRTGDHSHSGDWRRKLRGLLVGEAHGGAAST
jgi:hypothetical protein